MAIIKCKMCGGELEIIEGSSTARCEYCNSLQTIPKVDDENKLIRFERAERLRRQCEFDKAAGIYETIVGDFRQEAEAYWGLVLCKYGIEYVDDPATGNKIPTCHRSSFDSIMDDPDLELALENADPAARKVYREEAKAIEELRKGIIAVSANEKPYDIFICYKETDENGERTLDSVLAQDIYDALTGKGYRVFFSRISLEDKLGMEYEPYIFAALNSARVMLVFGTDYEYFNAVWVKNEWSRFLKLMAVDKEKHLIPCFKGIDAYDMPKEFAKFQAQDLGKLGADQDLLRGIEKYISPAKAADAPSAQSAAPTVPLLRRAFLFLEDGDWKSADEYCEKVLDIDPENAQAYLGKLMAECHTRFPEQLETIAIRLDNNNNYTKALRFGDDRLRKTLEGYAVTVNKRIESQRIVREKQAEEARVAAERERIAREAREAEERRRQEAKAAEERRIRQEQAAREQEARRKQEEALRQAEAEKQARLEESRRKWKEETEKRIKKHKNIRTVWQFLVLFCALLAGICSSNIPGAGFAVGFGGTLGILSYPGICTALYLRKSKWGSTPGNLLFGLAIFFCCMMIVASVGIVVGGEDAERMMPTAIATLASCVGSMVCLIVRKKS